MNTQPLFTLLDLSLNTPDPDTTHHSLGNTDTLLIHKHKPPHHKTTLKRQGKENGKENEGELWEKHKSWSQTCLSVQVWVCVWVCVRASLPSRQQLLYFWKPLRTFVVLGHYPRTTAIYKNTLSGRRFLRFAPINSVHVDFSINSHSSPQNGWGRDGRGRVALVCRYSLSPWSLSFLFVNPAPWWRLVFTLQMCICALCWFALWAWCPSSSSHSSSPVSTFTEDTGSKVEASLPWRFLFEYQDGLKQIFSYIFCHPQPVTFWSSVQKAGTAQSNLKLHEW